MKTDWIANWEQQIQNAMQEAQVPALAVDIIDYGRVQYQNAWGTLSIESDEAITPDTLFRIGSVTKPLTATLIMRLVQIGKLNLDLPISKYIDAKIGQNSIQYSLTLRHLLSHTGGIPDDLRYAVNPDTPTLASLIEKQFAHLQIRLPMGLAYDYSNLGINLAGYIAEVAMGKPYAELMKEWVFDPLGMTRTTFDVQEAQKMGLADAHILDADGELVVKCPPIDNPAHHPCGFALSTVNDLAKFALMHLTSSDFLMKDKRMMMRESIADLMTANEATYGLGLRAYDYKGVRLFGHNGAIGKYGAWFWFEPETQSGVVMLVNRAPNFWSHASSVLETIWDNLLYIPDISQEVAIEARDLPVGQYIGDGVGILELTSHGMLSRNFNEPVPLNALGHLWYMAQGATVGLINEQYLMFNGMVCHRLDEPVQKITRTADVEGDYTHDIDTFTLTHTDNGFTLYSMDDRKDYTFYAISETAFVGEYGYIEIVDDTLTWNHAFEFKRTSTS